MEPMEHLLSVTTLGVDGILEYRVITNNFSAEYGGSMGSIQTWSARAGRTSFTAMPLNSCGIAIWIRGITSICPRDHRSPVARIS